MKKLTTGNGHFCIKFGNQRTRHRRLSTVLHGEKLLYMVTNPKDMFFARDGSLGHIIFGDGNFVKESQPLLEERV